MHFGNFLLNVQCKVLNLILLEPVSFMLYVALDRTAIEMNIVLKPDRSEMHLIVVGNLSAPTWPPSKELCNSC